MTDTLAGGGSSPSLDDPLQELKQRLIRISTLFSPEDGQSTVFQTFDARSLLDQFSEEVHMTDRLGRLIFANSAAMARIRTCAPLTLTAENIYCDEVEARFLLEQELMARGTVDEREEVIAEPDGRKIWLLTTRTPLRNDEGQVVGLMVMSRDITERKQHDEIRQSYAQTLEMIARGKPLRDILERICLMVQQPLSGIYASILLFEEETATLRHGAAPSLPDAYTRIVDGIQIGPRVGSCGTAAWRREAVIVRDIQSDPLWSDFKELAGAFDLHSCWSTPLLGADGAVLGTFALYSQTVREPSDAEIRMTSLASDLAGIAIERARTEQKIRFMAHHDPLTGLPNRAMFWPQFSRALAQAARENRKITVAYIDLDNFKQINDGLGHAVGDEVLKVISHRLIESIRSTDLAVRLGGDEFAIVFSNPMQDEAHVLRRLDDIRRLMAAPIELEGHSIHATSSMGVAFFPKDGTTPEELLARADAAMYEAKAGGRDKLEVAPMTRIVSGRSLLAEACPAE
ncbi:diguanylate cyclase [Rhizobium lemnae]|uniref:Diguanylate cyclase domain-containing protein n=1 Tax=Rhizobium lemnae TaxID=1214924 RepID=A0ABV8EE49_9HYPH|nr:diguanylate cyclase [Rhizobium lemnae]MCJ8509233.1 diguanylate cyclase [Rhizobium lemnae]